MPTTLLKPGQRIPDWKVQDSTGRSHKLWDYRQKSHLVLLYDPEAKADTWKRWESAIHTDRKQWDWLNAKVLILKKGPKDMVPGIYLVDRYGMFMSHFPLDRWNFDDLEREFIYYEARHC